MIHSPNDMLLDLVIATDGQAEEPFSYRWWGYTVYRTCYTPASHSQWEVLIKPIQEGVERSIPGLQDDEPSAAAQLLRARLRLDFRSDASLYDGLGIDQLRQLYLNPPADWESSPNFDRSDRLFIVADADVLMDTYFMPAENAKPKEAMGGETSDVAAKESVRKWQYQYHGYRSSSSIKRRWLKCVEVDYIAENHHPRRRGQGPRPYFGWFMITADSVIDLWELLLDMDIEEIKPGLVDVELCK